MGRKRFYLDLLERVGWTFVQAFAAEGIASGSFNGFSFEVALWAGVIAIGKVLVANKLPWTANDSGSSLPREMDPPGGGGH